MASNHKTHKRPIGRPQQMIDGVTVAVRIDRTTEDAIQAYMESHGVTRSVALRNILKKALRA